MIDTINIFKKELSVFFKSPLFYFLGFLTSAVLGLLFSISIQKFAETSTNAMLQFGVATQLLNIHYAVFLQHLSTLNLMLIFLIPALTMKLISEEKKSRTFDLLLTAPIKSYSIVLGKYLAIVVVVFSLILVAFIYPLLCIKVFEFTWGSTVIAAIGILLIAAVYGAMNLFASSLTDNSIVAFVLAVVFNLSIWFIGAMADFVDTPSIKPILEHLSLNTHLASLIEGTIRTSGLVFFFSLIFIFCFLTERVIESARWR